MGPPNLRVKSQGKAAKNTTWFSFLYSVSTWWEQSGGINGREQRQLTLPPLFPTMREMSSLPQCFCPGKDMTDFIDSISSLLSFIYLVLSGRIWALVVTWGCGKRWHLFERACLCVLAGCIDERKRIVRPLPWYIPSWSIKKSSSYWSLGSKWLSNKYYYIHLSHYSF